MKARKAWNQIQAILHTPVDNGVPGPTDDAAFARLRAAAKANQDWPTSSTPPTGENPWREGKASSFADPADVRAFRRCKAQGKSDQECFKVGDNGIGKWGTDTTLPRPMCALPREDWAHLERPQGTIVLVEIGNTVIRAELQDTMPARANIKNGAIIDLNPAACAALGQTPPMLVEARWKWA